MKITTELVNLLSQGKSGNQAHLVELLAKKGIQTTQSSVSRALKKIRAQKGVDENGNIIYTLSNNPMTENDLGFFESLVHKIVDNGHLIVVHTKPGTANTVAKFIDDHRFSEVLGSVAGDDTIMIVPSDVGQTKNLVRKIKQYLGRIKVSE